MTILTEESLKQTLVDTIQQLHAIYEASDDYDEDAECFDDTFATVHEACDEALDPAGDGFGFD